MEKIKPLIPFILILPIAIFIIINLFPLSHPYGGLSLPLDRSAILDKAHDALTDLQLSDNDIWPEVSLIINRPLLRQAQKMKGISESNVIFRDSVPAYNWKIRWRKNNEPKFSFGDDDREDKKQIEKLENLIRGEITFVFDTRGRLIEFTRSISDTLQLPSLTSSQAKQFAAKFLSNYTSPTFKVDTAKIVSEQVTQQLRRTDYEFTWRSLSAVLGDPVNIKIKVSGNIVSSYEPVIAVPEMYKHSGMDSVSGIIFMVLVIAGGILIIIIAVKRIRSFEIGFRQALLMGSIVTIAFGIQLYINTMNSRNAWEIIIPMLVVPIFVGGTLVLLWAVSESLAREVWREKMIPFDLISKGRLLHPNIGWSFIRGISFGAILFAGLLLLIWVGNKIAPVSIALADDSSLHTFDVGAPWLLILSHAIFASLYLFVFIQLFLISFLRKYISSKALLLMASTIAMAVINIEHMSPLAISFGIQAFIALIAVLVFYKYDGLTALLALIVYALLPEVAGLFCTGNSSYTDSGMIILIAGLIFFIGAIILCFRKSTIQDFDEIAPVFAKHITERQRLQQELEIARSVQMSFLPKCDPSIPQFDICSRCVPAFEVGGDYYDFIEMGGKKLAVAVGDVSGKGTQAAFFMTLTKGFLRALAHVSESPAKILTQVNHLFYENVERGMFISMVYGVFDIEKKTLTIARAGHNPVIMRKSYSTAVQIVNPAGLALGLDAGQKFEKSIEEVTVEYQPGDLFIFYTDGFIEARNKSQDEYGEERLAKTVENLAHGTAAEILEGVFKETKSFAGKTQQHDDMTMVVVKVR
jgi:phosphoserine phosphatase RsbU/P